MGGICTAAYVAAYHNNGAGLRFLAGACGVDPNAMGDPHYGRRPIHIACREGNTDAVLVLLALGADPTVAGSGGWTPCMHAANRGSTACLRALAEGTARQEGRTLGVNVVGTEMCCAPELLPLEWDSCKGQTALDIAARNSDDEVAVCLRDELGALRAADLPPPR